MTSAALFYRFQSISISKDQTHIPEHYSGIQLRIDDVGEIITWDLYLSDVTIILYPDQQITTEIMNND